MTIKEQIDADLKAAMLQGDKVHTTTLRGLKSAVLYAEVAASKRDTGLDDSEVVSVLRKEAKKRQESADLFDKGGSKEKADAERTELAVINKYLPQQLSDEALNSFVQQAITELDDNTAQMMGKVIGRVKELSEGNVDGARIAKAVKERLEQK